MEERGPGPVESLPRRPGADQAKATFEAAKETGRDVYYEFTGDKSKTGALVSKLLEYSKRYDVNVKISFK